MQKLSLQQKLLQKLSPQQIQAIKLLEIPIMQLEQRIKKELEENPVLEDDSSFSEESYEREEKESSDSDQEEFSIDDYINEDEYNTSYKLNANNYSKDNEREDIPISEGETFYDLMHHQLGLLDVNEQEYTIACQIIGNIDEDGYLRRDLDAMTDDLAFMQNTIASVEEIEEILLKIQSFDPPGIGARDLQECLLLQLQRKDQLKASIILATKIIKDMFEAFSKRHYEKILHKYNINEQELKNAIDEIIKLNPKPGISVNNNLVRSNQTIVPDFILDILDGELSLSLNQRNVPELRISNAYSNILHAYKENKKEQSLEQKNTVMFVKQKLDAAKWFIDAIKQRQQTLIHVMNSIIEYQKEYFIEGDETKLKPMILKDIADFTGLDISTISRVSSSKYIQTHFGIYPVKYFFSESMQKENGEEVSTREIKKILAECIENEDKKKPLTDEKLAKILKEKSYPIARRTVAKYREQLDIPVARLRKEL